MVNKDEGIAPVSSEAFKEPAKTEALQEQHVNRAPVVESSMGDIQNNSSQINELKSALKKVYFDFDSYKLSGTARSKLEKNAELIKKVSAANIRVEGSCDERGSDEYNIALGEKRAKAAMQYLVTLGIPAERLSVISYGKEKPADTGHDEAAWAKNRRDEFAVESK